MNTKPIHVAVAVVLACGALAGCDRDDTRTAKQKVGEKARELAAKVEKSAEEAAITAQVKAELVKDPELSALKIDVDTTGSVVTSCLARCWTRTLATACLMVMAWYCDSVMLSRETSD